MPAADSTELIAAKSERDPGVDFSRALAVTLMVFGHTLDAVLSAEARSTGATGFYYGHCRGLTGVLFLFVSGFALWSLVAKPGRPLPAGRVLTKVGVLLLVGSFLNWPTGGLYQLAHGDLNHWAKWIAFGPLHCIAMAMAVSWLVARLAWGTRVRAGIFAALAVVVWGMSATQLIAPATDFVSPLRQLFGGGFSQYPLFPWLEFYFGGAAAALLLATARGWRRSAWLLGGGVLLVVASGQWDPSGATPDHPNTAVLRLGLVMVIFAVGLLAPKRLGEWTAPIGQKALWIYALHLPVVYGLHGVAGLWGRVGTTQSTGPALLIAAAVLLGSVFVAAVSSRLSKLAAARIRVTFPNTGSRAEVDPAS